MTALRTSKRNGITYHTRRGRKWSPNVSERGLQRNRRIVLSYVHTVNAKDYTKEQLDVWVCKTVDLKQWDASLREHYSVVVVEDEKIVGFGDIDATAGYLDRLYVHAEYQNKGVATAICEQLEKRVQGNIITHASITAKPFF